MPIYEYKCPSCGQRFEKRQKFTDEPVADCANCGAAAQRVLFPAGIIFKGSGWYKTDSRGTESSTIPSGSSSTANGDSSASTDVPKTPAASTSES